MPRLKRLTAASAALALAGLGAAALTSIPATASDSPRQLDSEPVSADQGMLLSARLAPSVPTDPAIFGIAAGGAPWSLREGNVSLGRDGSLKVEVHGLVLTATTANPIPDLAASVYCNGVLAGRTAPVSFTKEGNATIEATVSLPGLCQVPAVILNPATGGEPGDVLGIYIGFDGSAAQP
ncbi:MAG TPA: hypothetical protein VEK76_12725 [Candidatus Binatia bacterium]|nr:hypothetical protein [Candidatus Binatia bacterium]